MLISRCLGGRRARFRVLPCQRGQPSPVTGTPYSLSGREFPQLSLLWPCSKARYLRHSDVTSMRLATLASRLASLLKTSGTVSPLKSAWHHTCIPLLLAASRDYTSPATFPDLPAGSIIVPMPQLSPSMTHGSVKRWLKARTCFLRSVTSVSAKIGSRPCCAYVKVDQSRDWCCRSLESR